MNQFDAVYVAKLREALTTFLGETQESLAAHGEHPAKESIAATERSTYCKPGSVVNAWCLAQQLIELGADHVSAFAKLLQEPVEVNAVWTCVRSMLESCGIAAWLLVPEIGARERVARTFALRFEGMQQQLKYGRAAATPAVALDLIKKQIDKMENDAIYQGFPRLQKNGKRTGVAMQMPGATETIQSMLDEEAIYRLLSAVAHGHTWALLGLGYAPANSVPDDVCGDVVTKPFEKKANFQAIALFGSTIMKALAHPLWNQCHYFGWNALDLEEILERVADRMEMSVAPRFWRAPSGS
jgi:hypothetical protein